MYVELPSIGAKYSAGDSFGSVESVKAASDVYTPVAGEILEVNTALESNPGEIDINIYWCKLYKYMIPFLMFTSQGS